MKCPSCGEQAPDEAKWCEACGQDLNSDPLPVCVACNEREVGEDGYCLSCGYKQPEERDHMEFHDGSTVAVTDRGKRHRHNEDAVAIAMLDDGVAVLVVCDGVSSTPGSAEASERAAGTARDLLVAGLQGQVVEIDTLLDQAVEAAQTEASDSTSTQDDTPHRSEGPPSSTFVAVVVRPGETGTLLSTAWVGDSRAYWIGDDSKRLSLVDHEQQGSLERWLGADSIDPTADLSTVEVAGLGHVVVCSDGLWRYASEPEAMSELLVGLAAEHTKSLGLARAMVEFANEQGGHDNITVALWTNHGQRIELGAEDQARQFESGYRPESGESESPLEMANEQNDEQVERARI